MNWRQSGILYLVFDLLVDIQTKLQKKKKEAKNTGIKIRPQATPNTITRNNIFKKVPQTYALAADKAHTPITVKVALYNSGWPSTHNTHFLMFTEGFTL